MTAYKWRSGTRIKADAQAVGEQLYELQRLNDSRLTPRMVVDEARPVDSPLHPCFEWDETRAAELYREGQARQVISSIRVTGIGAAASVLTRVYVNVVEQVGEDRQHVYMPVVRVLEDDQLLAQVRAKAAADLKAFEDRYAQFEALVEIGRTAREQVEMLPALTTQPPAEQ